MGVVAAAAAAAAAAAVVAVAVVVAVAEVSVAVAAVCPWCVRGHLDGLVLHFGLHVGMGDAIFRRRQDRGLHEAGRHYGAAMIKLLRGVS